MADDKPTEDVVESPDPHFEPIVQLPKVEIKTMEEDEEELVKLRAKLYRYDNAEEPPEWKERGTGDVKLLKHKETGLVRILMRRDKTFKVCCNHFLNSSMVLKPNCGSDRAWVWSTHADFADEEPKPELLAIRFANAENAQKFKDKFDEVKEVNAKQLAVQQNGEKDDSSTEKEKKKDGAGDADEVAEKLGEMSVKDEKKEETKNNEEKKDTEENGEDKSEDKTDSEDKVATTDTEKQEDSKES